MNSFDKCKMCSGQIRQLNPLYNLVKCEDCGLIFCKDIFTDVQIQETYDRLYNKSSKYQSYQAEFIRLSKQDSLRLGWPKRKVVHYVLDQKVREVCEVGAGVGLVGVYLKKRNLSYMGIEMDSATAEKASSLGIDVRAGSFTQLAAYQERFDAVLGFEVIEHIQELKDFFTIVNKSLKPGGLLGFSVPNYNKVLNYPMDNNRLHQDGPPIHVNFFTEENLSSVLQLAGFEIQFLKTKSRPYFNVKKSDTYRFMLKSLIGKYHGPTIIGVAVKSRSL